MSPIVKSTSPAAASRPSKAAMVFPSCGEALIALVPRGRVVVLQSPRGTAMLLELLLLLLLRRLLVMLPRRRRRRRRLLLLLLIGLLLLVRLRLLLLLLVLLLLLLLLLLPLLRRRLPLLRLTPALDPTPRPTGADVCIDTEGVAA